jgi:hypothetical protein
MLSRFFYLFALPIAKRQAFCSAILVGSRFAGPKNRLSQPAF